MSDENHEEIHRLSFTLISSKRSEGFSAATLLFKLCERTCLEKQDHGHLYCESRLGSNCFDAWEDAGFIASSHTERRTLHCCAIN